MINKNHYKITLLILSLIFITLKIYFLFIAKVNFGSFAYSANNFIYYNTRAFSEIPQSFHDWNHPGTPIYYLTFILSSIFLKNLDIENFHNFLNIHHIFITTFTVIILNYSIIKLKKYLTPVEIFFSFLFIYSFYSFVHTLEVVDPTNYLFPLSILIVTQTIDLLNNPKKLRKKLIYFSLISSLAISIKMALLPLVVMSYLIITFDNLKKIKEIFVLNLTLFLSFIIFNLPIIGRIPRVIYTVLFVRSDTRFSLDDVFLQKILKLFHLIAYQNLFLIIMIFLFLIILMINFKKILKFSGNKNFIYSSLIFICFTYTLFVANDEINTFDKFGKTGFFLRNCYFNSIFIIPLFIWLFKEKKQFINSLKIFIYIFVLLSFTTNILFYDNFRNEKNIKIIQKKEKFENIINDLIPKNSLIAVYGDAGYGFENEMVHYVGNSLFAGEKFNKDLIASFKNVRSFRLHDFILNNFSYNELTPGDNLKKSIDLSEKRNKKWIKDIVYSFDDYLKNNLPKKVYLILSHNSHKLTSTFPGQANRPKNIFIKKKKEKIDYIIFNENNALMREFNISGISFIKKLEIYLEIKDINKIDIEKDKWFIVKL